MAYFSVPLLTLGWFIIIIILLLILRSTKRKMRKFMRKVIKFMDEMTDVKVSTRTTFRRPLRFKS